MLFLSLLPPTLLGTGTRSDCEQRISRSHGAGERIHSAYLRRASRGAALVYSSGPYLSRPCLWRPCLTVPSSPLEARAERRPFERGSVAGRCDADDAGGGERRTADEPARRATSFRAHAAGIRAHAAGIRAHAAGGQEMERTSSDGPYSPPPESEAGTQRPGLRTTSCAQKITAASLMFARRPGAPGGGGHRPLGKPTRVRETTDAADDGSARRRLGASGGAAPGRTTSEQTSTRLGQ